MPALSKFQVNLAFGEEGEKQVAEMLLDKGWPVIPLYQYETNDAAPSLFLAEKDLILPDLQVFGKENNLMWVEVKRKRQWVRYRNNIETGLNKRHAEHYLEIEKKTDAPVYIFFIHEKEKPEGVFYVRLKTAYENARFWNGLNFNGVKKSKPMVFFKKNSLVKFKGGKK
jgi:hypothetical protein